MRWRLWCDFLQPDTTYSVQKDELGALLTGLSELGNNKGTAEAGLMFIFDFLRKLIIG